MKAVKSSNTVKRASPRPRLSAEDRRGQILHSARAVFLRHGASGTRVKDLAEAAGVNPALLYQHFESKEEIFEEAVLRPLERAFADTMRSFPGVSEISPSGEVVREATETYIVHLLQAMDDIAALLGIALFDDLETGRTFFRERLEPVLDHLRDIVAAHLPTWDHADYDPETAVKLVFGTAWYFAIEDRFRSGPPRDKAQTASELTALVFDGLLPR
jgi:AcrR family transcriptional regulator